MKNWKEIQLYLGLISIDMLHVTDGKYLIQRVSLCRSRYGGGGRFKFPREAQLNSNFRKLLYLSVIEWFDIAVLDILVVVPFPDVY